MKTILPEEPISNPLLTVAETDAARPAPIEAPTPLQATDSGGMETGTGADDEPQIALGDRYAEDDLPLTRSEAARLLGDENG